MMKLHVRTLKAWKMSSSILGLFQSLFAFIALKNTISEEHEWQTRPWYFFFVNLWGLWEAFKTMSHLVTMATFPQGLNYTIIFFAIIKVFEIPFVPKFRTKLLSIVINLNPCKSFSAPNFNPNPDFLWRRLGRISFPKKHRGLKKSVVGQGRLASLTWKLSVPLNCKSNKK